MRYDNVLGTVGQTPCIRVNQIDKLQASAIWVTAEYFNPGGSVKDRPALGMIEDAEARGALQPGATIIEPTSGNTGIGLAMVAAVKGYRAVFVMAEDMSEERKQILKAFGAELVLTPADKGTVGAIEEARRLEREHHLACAVLVHMLEQPHALGAGGLDVDRAALRRGRRDERLRRLPLRRLDHLPRELGEWERDSHGGQRAPRWSSRGGGSKRTNFGKLFTNCNLTGRAHSTCWSSGHSSS